MKNLFLCAAILCPMLHFAQTSKGNMYIGGGIGLSSSNEKNTWSASVPGQQVAYKYTYFSISPTYAYFIADNLALGLSLNFNRSKNSNTYSPNTTNTIQNSINQSSQIGLFVRKYIPMSDAFKFFAGFGVNAGPSKYHYDYSGGPAQSYTSKGTQAYAGFDFGFAYFPVKQIGLHAGVGNLGWTHYKYTNDNNTSNSNGSKQNTLSLGLNTAAFTLGFAYFFGMN